MKCGDLRAGGRPRARQEQVQAYMHAHACTQDDRTFVDKNNCATCDLGMCKGRKWMANSPSRRGANPRSEQWRHSGRHASGHTSEASGPTSPSDTRRRRTTAPGGYAPQPAPGGYAPQPAPGGYAPQPGGYPSQPAPGGYATQPPPGGYPPQPPPGGYTQPPPAPAGYAQQPPHGGYNAPPAGYLTHPAPHPPQLHSPQ
ncbi:hypothetical protein AB1Y20_004770 [Prymnesium parvum]|uniref:Uncharacterized protein n=1 Tax=Prymnesium parvum TaxID=97485 RepID=A0AB34IXJ4_PRYPA